MSLSNENENQIISHLIRWVTKKMYVLIREREGLDFQDIASLEVCSMHIGTLQMQSALYHCSHKKNVM